MMNINKIKVIALGVAFCAVASVSAAVSLIPAPREIKENVGFFESDKGFDTVPSIRSRVGRIPVPGMRTAS